MSFFFGSAAPAAAEIEDESTAGGKTYPMDDLLMRQHEERRLSELSARYHEQTKKSVDARKQFYQQSVRRLMEAGDTRKQHPAPGAEAFDGHAEAAGLETRDRRRVAVYNLQTAAQKKRGADEALRSVAKEIQRVVVASTGDRVEIPRDVTAASEAAEQLCMQRARELDAARNLCRKLSMAEVEIAAVERCVPESGVAESAFAAAAATRGNVHGVHGGGGAHPPPPPPETFPESPAEQQSTALVYQRGVEAAASIDAAAAAAASRAASIAADVAASVTAGGTLARTTDAARELATRLEAFAKHPNPNHPDFYEDLRKYRDAAKDLAERSEETLRLTERTVLAEVRRLGDAVADVVNSQVPALRAYMAETKGRAYQDRLAAGHVSSLSEDVRRDAFRVYCETFKAEMDELREGFFTQANAGLVEEKARMHAELSALRARAEAAEEAAAKLSQNPIIDENVRVRRLLEEAGFDPAEILAGAGVDTLADNAGGVSTLGGGGDAAATLVSRLRDACDVHEKKRAEVERQKKEVEEQLAFEKTRLAAEETALRWNQAELERATAENERRLQETRSTIEAEAAAAREARSRVAEEAAAEGEAVAAAAAARARDQVRAEVTVLGERLAAVEAERDAARREAERASLCFERDKMVYSKEMRDMKEDLKNKTEKVGSFLDILLQEAFLSELGGDANAAHFKLLGEYAVPGEGEIELMSDKERAFTVLKSVIKGVERAVNNGKNESIMLVPKSKHEAREREYADNLRRMEEASASMQRTMEEQLAAEATRRAAAEAAVTQTMDALKAAEEAMLELRKAGARAEERHAAQMSAFRAETQADSERVVAARCANLEAECERLNGEVASAKGQLEDARALLAENAAKLTAADDAVRSFEGAKLAVDEELATSKEATGRFQAEVEKELRRVKVDKEVLEHHVAELQDAVRVAKEQTVRELQKKRDAEAERDEAAATARRAGDDLDECRKELARLGQLVEGEVPAQYYREDADAASFAADAAAEFNAKVKTMETADLIKLMRGKHIEHVRGQRELRKAKAMLEQGLDAPQVALRKELRAANEERERLEIELRTWKANQPRFQAMEAERDHMRAQLSKAVLAQKKAEDASGEARAFATQQYVEKSKYAREVETATAEKRLMGVLATGAYEDAKQEHRKAEFAKSTAEGMALVQQQALLRVEEERSKREAAYVKMAEMERELQAERAKVAAIAGNMQLQVEAATEEVWRARHAHEEALRIATHATEDAVAAKSAFDHERAAARDAFSRERSARQGAARALADERARSHEMVVERYLAQHGPGAAARAAHNMNAAAASSSSRVVGDPAATSSTSTLGDAGTAAAGGGGGLGVGGGSVPAPTSRERAVERAGLAREGPAAAMAARTSAAARQHGMGGGGEGKYPYDIDGIGGGGAGGADGAGAGADPDPIAAAAAAARADGRDPAAAAMAAAAAGFSHRVDNVSAALHLAADAAAAGNHAAAFAPTSAGAPLNRTGQPAAERAADRSADASAGDWAEARVGMVRHNTSHQIRLDNQMGILRNQMPGGRYGAGSHGGDAGGGGGGGVRNGDGVYGQTVGGAEGLAMQNRTVMQQREAEEDRNATSSSSSWFPSLW